MDISRINRILSQIGYPHPAVAYSPFRAEEDGSEYSVWKIETDHGPVVLKKVTGLDLALSGTIRMTLQGDVTTFVSRRYVKKIKQTLLKGGAGR